ncbi:UDP-N-acetylmuramate--L-alanine ligase [Anabaena cylindrica FACHB-243]|uniref:UDP-N-acetylmuramate--L-alanine ligase n=1 Tax=Anabaena cylindrica (strain ATCC 27899 / PCC 7122) TaxID=272123 RepID=K9ZB98_ANACC|nr:MULTISPECIES: UDP-N-acetylmuramate--L-alanine ligase [Anabaena]AFZ55867.1 UDP-N-acetylmuramate--L-alanine ligase [Anabaena cylindrica PCC 7122]MBD2421288.1 UDP-N-acetylmuramate--L-alanine ligase [Anabaena cylindrica FACHB-243]MBY5285209.1 UDP-N-acetylmuramate--L-alanine ligase [Anabaena sp. CCAP 1446/1C]MBY5309832.1 UDP-N-acetylmuramate--L-alanine ligase [Anabaena sp. CCAP 1446/1C]MCM2406620.1 UDP-N-acetylmuramate--L-alanine ligase [Anabaena sp. CCAP 1446/1C]
MSNSIDFNGRPFHFIGIGGIGMSALAYVLAKRQIPVSGSDLRPNQITRKLESLGAHIFSRQEASNLEFFRPQESTNGVLLNSQKQLLVDHTILPQVICSTAINTSNLEYKAALELGCPILHRSDVLAALIADYHSIAVAGTHGKTTTSSMIGYMLLQAGLDPTILVGGEVNAWEGNARLGASQYLVAEADESDGSLVKHAPEIGIITNIELDHPDHYETLEEVIDTFQQFAQGCKTLIGSIDCETVRDTFGRLAQSLKPTISYSLHPDTNADYTVTNIDYRADGTTALVWEKGKAIGVLNLRLLSRHNLSNALAAVAVGRLLGLEFGEIAKGIATFEGARRRFEFRGEAAGITFIDDYAHHPSEIRATLAAARLQARPGQRVVAIFQPHRYSRTLTFLEEFAESFTHADVVVLTDIYSAGEPDLGQISGEQLAAEIAKHHQQVIYQPTLSSVCESLLLTLRPGDLALFLGAGNLNQAIPEIIATLREPATVTATS